VLTKGEQKLGCGPYSSGLDMKVSQKVMTVLRYLRSDVASNEKEGRCKQYHSSLIYA
jgi:hypothetical protein